MADNNNNDQEPRRLVIIERLSEQAVMPVKSSTGTAYILLSPKTMTLPGWTKNLVVPTDWAFTIPVGIAFQMTPTPGIAWQTRNRILGTVVIPSKEPQAVTVTMYNDSDTDIEIKAGDPIGQLQMFGTINTADLIEVVYKCARSGQYLVNGSSKRAKSPRPKIEKNR